VSEGSSSSLRAVLDRRLEALGRSRVAFGFAFLAFVVYLASNPIHDNLYSHYVWQADAWLHGRFDIAWPASSGAIRNDYYHDILPAPGRPGLGQIPYPPLPAVILLPFVAALGLGTDAEFIAAAFGALNAALAWLVASRLTSRPTTALAAAVFFAFGTVAWIAGARGTTWYFAHDVAMTGTFVAILATLAGADRTPRARDPVRLRIAAGTLLGLAALARLTSVFGAPFLLVAQGDDGPVGTPIQRLRAAAPTAIGVAAPIAALVAYNVVSSGQLFQPAYDELYRTETPAIESLRHLDWNIVDPRYVPQNLVIMLFEPPALTRQCGILPLSRECPDAARTLTLTPDPLGMSLLLTSPGWLIGLAALRHPRTRIAVAAAVAVGAIALVDLMHFSQGWVQFGYRFSNDWAPFGLVLVALGLERLGLRRLTLALIAVSVLVTLWGVYWSELFGW
jgi:hypothetical protein